MNVDCTNILLIGFDDIIVTGLMVGIPISLVALSQFKLVEGGLGDHFLWSNYEVVWLILPIMVFVGFGVSSCWLSYELIQNSWLEFTLIISAYQWYWCYEVLELGVENSIISAQEVIKCMGIMNIVTNSGDVLHSLSVLNLGIHTDCIPGKIISHDTMVAWSQVMGITCQEICGNGHSGITLGIIM